MTSDNPDEMLSAWTPGPWAIGEHEFGEGRRITATIDGVTFTVCRAETPVFGGAPRHDLREGSARLIAAAPDLAEALRDLAEMFHAYSAAVGSARTRPELFELAFDHFVGDEGCTDAWQAALTALSRLNP